MPTPAAPPLFWFAGGGSSLETVESPALAARRAVDQGITLARQGQFAAALDQFREAVRLQPSESTYHCHVAAAAERTGQLKLAERHLLEAVRLDPRCAEAHASLSAFHRVGGRIDLALHHSAIAMEIAPQNQGILRARANALVDAGHAHEAWAVLEPLVDGDSPPERWTLHLYARIAPLIGHEARALEAVERTLRGPGLSADRDGRPLLHFTASELLDRLRRYDEAFEHARQGNELIRSVSRPYDPAVHAQWVDRKVRYFTRPRLETLPRASHGDRRPVFIVGMPRSGTSLVEQILGNHPAVYPAGELYALQDAAKSLFTGEWSEGERYPLSLDFLSARRADRLAKAYLDHINSLDPNATYVTDKMPVNALYLDLVQLLFPGCKVIHCVRDPIDTCLSSYMINFAEAHEFTLDLAHLGAYYRDYRRLMDHWKRVLTIPILDVRYEDVVADTEAQARRMLEFLGLPWDEACLRYYESTRHVNTASQDQVRRPIYTSSMGRWKRYERHLGPLRAALGPDAAS